MSNPQCGDNLGEDFPMSYCDHGMFLKSKQFCFDCLEDKFDGLKKQLASIERQFKTALRKK